KNTGSPASRPRRPASAESAVPRSKRSSRDDGASPWRRGRALEPRGGVLAGHPGEAERGRRAVQIELASGDVDTSPPDDVEQAFLAEDEDRVARGHPADAMPGGEPGLGGGRRPGRERQHVLSECLEDPQIWKRRSCWLAPTLH